MIRSIHFSLVALLLACLAITSCSDDPASAGGEPPEMPPSESMKMDFSEYESQNKQLVQNETASTENFGRAVVTATVMKAIVNLNLAIPRGLLQAAANADAEFDGEGEWTWSYSKSEGEHTYSVDLTANVSGDNNVTWSLYVTNTQLGLDNQLFFLGETNMEGTEGTWTYFNLQNTETQEEISTVNWTVNGEEDIDLRLEVTSDRNDNQGDYIEYHLDNTTKSAVYFDASDEASIELQIDTETHAGFIIAPNYNDGAKACWDDQFQDVSCSS